MGKGYKASGTRGFRFVKLWENASPTSEFAAQTITVADMSGFDFLMLEYSLSTTVQSRASQIVTRGNPVLINASANANSCGRRHVHYESDTKLRFETSNFNDNTSNTHLIPVTIYGIKGAM